MGHLTSRNAYKNLEDRINWFTQGAPAFSGTLYKILQVLYNLINNAVNYSGDSRLIEVGCYRTEAGAVRLEVIDHGEGIPQEKLPDIWQRA